MPPDKMEKIIVDSFLNKILQVFILEIFEGAYMHFLI